jgi:hypothetical protein
MRMTPSDEQPTQQIPTAPAANGSIDERVADSEGRAAGSEDGALSATAKPPRRLASVFRQIGVGASAWSTASYLSRGLVLVVAGAALGLTGYVLVPTADERPIQPGEDLTVPGGLHGKPGGGNRTSNERDLGGASTDGQQRFGRAGGGRRPLPGPARTATPGTAPAGTATAATTEPDELVTTTAETTSPTTSSPTTSIASTTTTTPTTTTSATTTAPTAGTTTTSSTVPNARP